MSWFDGFGLLFVAALLVPNILFAATHPDGFENRYHNPTVERLEQVGRFGCFILMVLRIPVLCHGYWFDGGETVQQMCIRDSLKGEEYLAFAGRFQGILLLRQELEAGEGAGGVDVVDGADLILSLIHI